MSRELHVDDKLSALYRTHLSDAAPSAASDARVLRMAQQAATSVASAQEAAVIPAVLETSPAVTGARDRATTAAPARAPRTGQNGWRSWLSTPWFGPGLAFATIASLSVVVVALMPKDEMAIERDVATPAATPSKALATAALSEAPATIRDAARADRSSPAPAMASNQAASQPAPATKIAPAPALRSARALPSSRADAATVRAAPAPRSAAVRDSRRAVSPQLSGKSATAQSVAPQQPEPNPFPAQSRAPTIPPAGGASAAAAPATRDAAHSLAPSQPPPPPAASPATVDTSHIGKPSLLTEPTESRIPAPIVEVPDSAPTYPNEAQPSIPLPYSYQSPRRSRDTAVAAGVDRRAEKSSAAPSLAAAHPPRDPVEWVKAMLKLKGEGRNEQVLRELADFRKLYPQYVLPEELRNLK